MKYLDTSGFVKFYRKHEEGSPQIHQLIQNATDGKETLISSFVMVGETVSVFDKWVRRRYISGSECHQLTQIFLADLKRLTDDETLRLEPVSTLTIARCLELILKHHLSLNDALHLYTALANKGIVDQFVCSDQLLLKAAKAEGFAVLDPETKSSGCL